ncbi:MAG: amino acid ABC transporter permease [Solirubrobacterales bacterium]
MDRIIQEYFDFDVMFDPDNLDKVLEGFWFTVRLSIIAGITSLVFGLFLALLRQTPGKWGAIVRWPTIAYIDVFRGVPALLTILIVSLSLGALSAPDPETGEDGPLPRFLGVPDWFGLPAPFWYGVIALTLTYGAYLAEVYRAGIEAVPSGQSEAARSLGMSHGQTMRHVVVPQAINKVIPPLLNDFIALMKDTTLVSVIGLIEVVQAGRDIQSETLNSSALMLGAILFILVTIPMARLVDYLIVRQQRKTQRTGGSNDDTDDAAPQPGLAGA